MPSPAVPSDRLALNLITLGTRLPFEQLLDACVRHDIRIVTPWLAHYQDIGRERAAQALRERGLRVNSLCRIAGFAAASTPEAWRQALDEALSMIHDAEAMQAKFITFTAGGLAPGARDIPEARQRVAEALAILVPAAKAAGTCIAVEPLHPMVAAERGVISTLKQAVELAVVAGAEVLVDAYNVWWDPDLEASLQQAAGRIVGYQVSDWLVPTTDLAFDRGMMGDGVIDLRRVRAAVERVGYDGPVEVEILSGKWSARPIDEVIGVVKQRFAEHC